MALYVSFLWIGLLVDIVKHWRWIDGDSSEPCRGKLLDLGSFNYCFMDVRHFLDFRFWKKGEFPVDCHNDPNGLCFGNTFANTDSPRITIRPYQSVSTDFP